MKKITILHLLLLMTFADGRGIESEIGINVGVNSTKNEGKNQFKNPTVGVTYMDNRYVVMPRVDVSYTKVRDDYASSLLKASINAVYEYENPTYTTPYVLGGVGYEYVSGGIKDVFESHPFVQGGAGVRVDLEQGYKARVEGKMLQVLGNSKEGNEFMLTAGVSIPLNYQQKKIRRPRVVKPQPKVIYQQPVIIKEVSPKPRVVYIDKNECPLKIDAPDFDRDGVENRFDQCPATPCNFTVDVYGCPVKTTLEVHFATNSARLTPASRTKIQRFAHFLLINRGSFVEIVGHTDSVGSAKHNLVLSEQRANAVVHALLNLGVSSARFHARGEGERMPIASNKSAEGRLMNRRIEAVLTYPKGRR